MKLVNNGRKRGEKYIKLQELLYIRKKNVSKSREKAFIITTVAQALPWVCIYESPGTRVFIFSASRRTRLFSCEMLAHIASIVPPSVYGDTQAAEFQRCNKVAGYFVIYRLALFLYLRNLTTLTKNRGKWMSRKRKCSDGSKAREDHNLLSFYLHSISDNRTPSDSISQLISVLVLVTREYWW